MRLEFFFRLVLRRVLKPKAHARAQYNISEHFAQAWAWK